MKKIISVILVLSLLAVFSASVFAKRDINSFETLFENQLPTYMFDTTEFEAGEEYIVYVSTPINQELFEADGGAFQGVRGTIVRDDVVCTNAEIITIEEVDPNAEDYNYVITFMPTKEGEFSLEFTMRIFGFDIYGDDYRYIKGDEWVYTFATEPLAVAPSSKPDFNPDSSGATSSSAVSETVSDSTSSHVQVNPDEEGPSVWIWIVVAAVVVAGAVVAVIVWKKKLIK